MKLSTLQAWRQVYLAEAGIVAGTHLTLLRHREANGPTSSPRTLLRWAHRTLMLGAALWLMHDIAHRRWRSVAGDLFAVTGCGLGLAMSESAPNGYSSPASRSGAPATARAAAALLALAGTIRSSAFPETD